MYLGCYNSDKFGGGGGGGLHKINAKRRRHCKCPAIGAISLCFNQLVTQ